ncbi:hypothetical protein C8Q77DRAFT_373159 [Trametes polyzona]|nr:hypothetical protein C8Q77DRAFT_373159 [Trametes polyzona]
MCCSSLSRPRPLRALLSMLTQSLLALVVSALCLGSAATPPTKPLKVTLTGPTAVKSIDEVKITAAVTNTGSQPVKVLKHGSILDGDLPTRSFIVSKDGVKANFTGIKVHMRNVQAVNQSGSAYTTIHPGETRKVIHQVSQLYDFEALGPGNYTFEPAQPFFIPTHTGQSRLVAYQEASSSPIFTVHVTQDVARRKLASKNRRAESTCADHDRDQFINDTYHAAKTVAKLVSTYLSNPGPAYNTYFGAGFDSLDRVRKVFENIANEDNPERTLNCDDPHRACDGDVVAYTTIPETNIYFCDIFFNEQPPGAICDIPVDGDDKLAVETMLHELAHATSNINDLTYGCEFDRDLAEYRPGDAANNADSYSCFAHAAALETVCRSEK